MQSHHAKMQQLKETVRQVEREEKQFIDEAFTIVSSRKRQLVEERQSLVFLRLLDKGNLYDHASLLIKYLSRWILLCRSLNVIQLAHAHRKGGNQTAHYFFTVLHIQLKI